MQGLILKETGWHLIERLPEEPKQPPHYIDFTHPDGSKRHFEFGGDVFGYRIKELEEEIERLKNR